MYNFIFCFVYLGRLKKDGKGVAIYTAKLAVTIAIVMHVALLYSVLRLALCYYWNISIARSNVHATSSDRLLYFLIGLSIFLVTNSYYNKQRIEKVSGVYDSSNDLLSFKNILKFISLFVIPLLLGIYFVNKSVGYCY